MVSFWQICCKCSLREAVPIPFQSLGSWDCAMTCWTEKIQFLFLIFIQLKTEVLFMTIVLGTPGFGEGYTSEKFLDNCSCNLFRVQGVYVAFRKGLACFLIQIISDMGYDKHLHCFDCIQWRKCKCSLVGALRDSKDSSRLTSVSVVSGSCLSGKYCLMDYTGWGGNFAGEF